MTIEDGSEDRVLAILDRWHEVHNDHRRDNETYLAQMRMVYVDRVNPN